MVGLVINQSSFLNIPNTFIMYIRKLLINFKMEDEHKHFSLVLYFITAISTYIKLFEHF